MVWRVVTLVACSVGVSASGQTFYDVRSTDPNIMVILTDISDDGGVASGFREAIGFAEAFRWTGNDGIEAIDVPGALRSWALGVSGDGRVLFGQDYVDDGLAERNNAWRWSLAEGGDVAPALVDWPSAGAVTGSHDGSLIGGIAWATFSDRRPILWTRDAGLQLIDPPEGYDSAGLVDVSSTGNRVVVSVGRTWIDEGQSYIWQQDTGYTHVDLSDIGAASSPENQVTAISADGRYVVGAVYWSVYAFAFHETQAFRWSIEGGTELLADADDGFDWHGSEARDVSADGSVIIGTWSTPNGDEPFLWREGLGAVPMRTLSPELDDWIDGLSPLSLWFFKLSADGSTVIGANAASNVSSPEGLFRSFVLKLATPLPCPADFTTEATCQPNTPDGAVTLADFACYLSEWTAQSSSADITGAGVCDPTTNDTVVDLSDFACYLSAWAQGCP